MKEYFEERFDEERALYGSDNIRVIKCSFDGPADGESAMKESKNIFVSNSYFNLRYPFWHDENVKIIDCEMTDKCRAALWYSNNIDIENTKMHGIKALRESGNIQIKKCDIVSPEFGWFVLDFVIKDSRIDSEYCMMKSNKLRFENIKMSGKYSFQYIEDCVFDNCDLDTKDAFWHAKNVYVKDCKVKGEYLAWYCENVTFENCTIIGTQPLCYCKNLKLINCKMIDADLSFEKSEVEADLIGEIISIKNPKSGYIKVDGVDDIIMDDEYAKAEIIINS